MRSHGRAAVAVALVPLGTVAGHVGGSWLAGEHALEAGHGGTGLVTDPTLRWGLAAQVVTAALLVLAAAVARASGERVRALLWRPPATGPGEAAHPWRLQPGPVRSLHLASPASERGPPRHLLIA